MTLLQAAAALTLWRSGRFDTLDIAKVLGGACRRPTSAGSSTRPATGRAARICAW